MKRISSAGNPWLICLIAVCSVFLVLSGCTSQQPVVATGNTVKVFYSVSFPGGEPFETNKNATPLEFTAGAGMVVPGFEEAVLGLSPGQTRIVTIPPEKAYGPYKPELVYTALTEEATARFNELKAEGNLEPIYFPDIGVAYKWKADDGAAGFIRFYNDTPETIIVDQNHPLAGKDLVFEITLVEIVEKTGQ